MKRFCIFFGILSLLLLIPRAIYADRYGFVNTVVIDPGHGGSAPGAVGKRSKEKDIVLDISLKLGEYIKQHLPDVKVIYTRTTDEFVEFYRRAEIANENHADLFISVHANAVKSSSAIGTETFVMGLHRSEASLEVARKENADILLEEDYEERYVGFDPRSPEASIIFTLFQNAHLDQSLRMASLVQQEFRERARRIDRGVKQAGFFVLYKVTMPSILVETGFISNPREEEYLMSERGQAEIASSIFRAFRTYKEEQDALAAARLASHPSTQGIIKESPEATTARIVEPEPVRSEEPTREHNADDAPLRFRVQFITSATQREPGDVVFKGLENIGWYFHAGLYKYTVGNESTLEAAAELQTRLHEKGYKDAFIVSFLGNERISHNEAMQLLNERSAENGVR